MISWLLLALIRRALGAAPHRTASIASNKSRLGRASLRDMFSILKKQNRHKTAAPQWFDTLAEFNAEIMANIMLFLDPNDAVKLLCLCKTWSHNAAEVLSTN